MSSRPVVEQVAFAFPKVTCPSCGGWVTLAPAGFYILHRTPEGVPGGSRVCPASGEYQVPPGSGDTERPGQNPPQDPRPGLNRPDPVSPAGPGAVDRLLGLDMVAGRRKRVPR